MDPESTSVEARAHGLFTANENPAALQGDIRRALSRIGEMQQAFNELVEVRVTSYIPSYGLILIDPDDGDSTIIVELYPYMLTSSDRAHFEITRRDTRWFLHFL